MRPPRSPSPGLHVPPETAAAIVDFVHAQRRRFNLGKACSPSWRPLQPGGEVLPGDTPEAQDRAFAQYLVDGGHRLVTEPVVDLEDAHAMLDAMVETDLRRLRIGIPFPRWTEDGFHGPAHSTGNDYLMGVGRVPNDHATWYALEDRYVADPSDDNFFEMMNRYTNETNDTGFSDATIDANRSADGRCGKVVREFGAVLSFIDEAKHRSLLIVQHFMRMALLGRPGWYDQPAAPFSAYSRTYGEGLNPFWRLGAQFAEFNCRNAGDILATWPEEPAAEIPASDLANGEAVALTRELNHPWQTLAMVYDQTLLMQEGFANHTNLHYWAINGFVQNRVHLPFMYLHRVAQQTHYWNALRGTDAHPELGINHFAEIEVHPLLDADRMRLHDKMSDVGDDPDILDRTANTVRCNAIRTVLLLQKERLEAGEPLMWYRDANNTRSHPEQFSAWSLFAERVDNRGDEAILLDAYAGRGDLCTAGLQTLISEVDALASAAEDVAPAE